MTALQPNQSAPDWITQLIQGKLGLFSANRTAEQDQKILEIAYGFCIDQTVVFLRQNLSPERLAGLEQELSQPNLDSNDLKIDSDILATYLATIPEVRLRLQTRLDNALNHLIRTAISLPQPSEAIHATA